MAKFGAKTKYKPEYVYLAEIACQEGGFTQEQLGKLLGGVSQTTIGNWKRAYPEFKNAVDQGIETFEKVTAKQSLLKRLSGYFYNETTSSLIYDTKSGESEMKVSKVVKKHMPADVQALTLFLLNRDSENWKYRQHVDVNVLQKLSDKEIEKRIGLIVDNTKKRQRERASG